MYEVDRFFRQGQQWIADRLGSVEIDYSIGQSNVEAVLDGITSLEPVGIYLLLGKIFDTIGFAQISDKLFRHLAIYRLAYPKSKLKTSVLLQRNHRLNINEDQVYRYLDKLEDTQKERVQQISFEHTRRLLGGEVKVVFYDVTTLYFEIDKEDDLRKTGFSKEGRHRNPQVLLCLLVSEGGYPLAYEVFEGNKFEGHTMLPVLEGFRSKYGLAKLVVVADSGLMSGKNLERLRERGYSFILGARIKNQAKRLQQRILSLELVNGQHAVLELDQEDGHGEPLRLIITYSEKRAEKDKKNRQKGLARLEKQLASGKLGKAQINNRGYNKYLKLEGETRVSIDREKFEQDAQWDGLKGYLTNAGLGADQTIKRYKELWQIEKAFRVQKSDLKVRPFYHRLPKRIRAHVCISFVAYKMYKELERQLVEKKAKMSVQTAIEIAKTIHQVKVQINKEGKEHTKLLLLTDEQKQLAKLFGF